MSKSILKIVLFVLLLTGLLEGIPSIQAQDTGTLQKIKTQFGVIVGIDWLIAIAVIAGAVMTLFVSDRIVLKLMKQQANYKWQNRFK
jgi:formate hydrogenlyase subunit 3/multisubunit Na+/H+ antiporter MnhD subunit